MATFQIVPRIYLGATCFAMAISSVVAAGPVLRPAVPLDRAINTVLHLEHSWNTVLRIDSTLERAITVVVPIENLSYTLELEPHSTRADTYQVLMQDDNGELYEVPAGPVRTLRGTVLEVPGSVVAASLMEDGLYARIRFATGQEYWMEPITEKIDGAPTGLYAFYRNDDIIPSGGLCAADDIFNVASILDSQANYYKNGQSSSRGGTIICTADLGVDTDFEYFQAWGGSTEARINQVVDAINIQYESEVLLSHLITTIIVRSSSSDPYTSNDAATLLNQFTTEWQNNQGGIPHDLAHLFTGRSINGGTIGIAWLSSVCSSVRYGLAESDCCGSFGCATDLSAHEMGHGWAAQHCSCTSFTMNPFITCSNQFTAGSINTITAFAASVNCLTCQNTGPTGACCVAGNQCLEIVQSNCIAGGGVYQGDGTLCAQISCLPPVGACCLNGACTVSEEAVCIASGGTYAGNNTDCQTVSCSLGACCIGLSCSQTLQQDCTGSWFGANSQCVDITCGAGADQFNHTLSTWSRSDGTSMETYDVYLPSTDPNSRLVSVFGQDADVLQINTWSNSLFDGSATQVALHQSLLGGDGPHDRSFDPLFDDDFVFDSYVTIGTDDAAVGVPLFLGFDTTGFNSATGVFMTNGVWFVIPDDPIASIGAGTVDGHRVASFSVEAGQGVEILANVQWFDGANIVHDVRNIYWNNLGLGGVVCLTDLNGNGSTDVGDILELIGQFGVCPGCSADFDGNGSVDVSDLLIIIAAWGPC